MLARNPRLRKLLSDKTQRAGPPRPQDEAAAIYDQLLAEHPNDAPLLIDIREPVEGPAAVRAPANLLVRVVSIYGIRRRRQQRRGVSLPLPPGRRPTATPGCLAATALDL
ncbi:MAG: hypothetical protein IPM94_15215 [bacterium]|nr:hypothetical protein [bacterium]